MALGFGFAGALMGVINKLLAIIEDWLDERRVRKARDDERAKVASENNEAVYKQLDSARATKAQVESMSEGEVDAILDRDLKP